MLDSAIRHFGLSLRKSIAVGDRITDLMAAHKAGVDRLYLLNTRVTADDPFEFEYKQYEKWKDIIYDCERYSQKD